MAAVFESGAKSSERRPRYDLIPLLALEREAQRMAEGAASHGENNYQKGAGDPVYVRDRVNHLIHHALLYASGDRSDDHLAAIRANAGMLIWLDAQQSLLNGRVYCATCDVTRQVVSHPLAEIRCPTCGLLVERC